MIINIVVVIANKQDLPNALKKDEIKKALDLNNIGRTHEIFPATATENAGLTEALDWLSENMKAIEY